MKLEDSRTPQNARTVHCDRHGDMREAFVCGHLLFGDHLGFFEDTGDFEHDPPNGWCSGCEGVRLNHGGVWNDESTALINIRLVCRRCYDEIKERNTIRF
jgi:hypothetical protein